MILPLIVLSVLCAMVLPAAEYRIGPGDNVQATLALLKRGDTLMLDEGEYTQSFVLNNLKGTATAPITIDGQAHAVILPRPRDGIYLENCEHIVLLNLTIRNARRAGIIALNTRNLTISNCTVQASGKWGIQTCLSDSITVEECEVSHTVRQHGIYFSTTDRPVVRNSRIHHNAACGIHLNGDKAEGGDGMITGALIEDNRIYENGQGGGAAINMDGVEESLVRGNTLYNNHAGGIGCFKIDAARVGSGNQILENVVHFRKGQGRYAIQFLGCIQRTRLTGNTLACGRGPVLELDAAAVEGLISDGNLFFAYGRWDVVGIGERRYTLEEWRQMSGNDRGSKVGRPGAASLGRGM